MENSQAKPILIIFMCCLMNAIDGAFCIATVPALLPVIAADLGFDLSASGYIWGVVSIGVCISAIIGGVVVDRFGPHRIAGIAMILGALAVLSRVFAEGPDSLALTMFFYGTHVGFIITSLPKMLAGHVPAEKLGGANGLVVLSVTLATACTMMFSANSVEFIKENFTFISGQFTGWQVLMLITALLQFVFALIWLLSVHDRIEKNKDANVIGVFLAAKNKQVVRLALLQALQFGSYITMMGLLPVLLTRFEFVSSVSGAGFIAAVWLITVSIGSFVGPFISDLIGLRKPVILLGALLAVTGLGGLAFAITLSGSPESFNAAIQSGNSFSQMGVLPYLCLAALGSGFIGPLLFSLPGEIKTIGPKQMGAVLGLMLLTSQIYTAILSTSLGVAADKYGFTSVLIILAVLHFLILVPLKGLDETGMKIRKQEMAYE